MPNKGSGKPDYGPHTRCDVESCHKHHNECGHDYFDPEGCSACIYEQGFKDALALTDEELKRVRAVNEMYGALKSISELWPEPPNCADIMAVNGVNDGKSRAIIADAAIKIARKALALADGREPERGER